MNGGHAHRLRGLTAIWTGSRDGAGDLLDALEREGATIEHLPLIELSPPADEARIEAEFAGLGDGDWLVFTSREATKVIAGRRAPRARIAAIGPATAKQLEDGGWRVDLIPAEHSARGLARALTLDQGPCARVLFLRGDKALHTLPDLLKEAGLSVDELEVYRTLPVSREQASEVVARIRNSADVVIIGSPMGVQALLMGLGSDSLAELKEDLSWICLGPTTKKALQDAGVAHAVYPQQITPQAFVETIVAEITPQK